MELKIALERYGRYYEYLQKLGSYKRDASPKATKLKISKAATQSAYAEMTKMNFNGSIVEYLCLISTYHLVFDIKKLGMSGPIELQDYGKGLIQSFHSPMLEPDANNTLRLFMRDPNFFFDAIKEIDPECFDYDEDTMVEDSIALCSTIVIAWMSIFMRHRFGQEAWEKSLDRRLEKEKTKKLSITNDSEAGAGDNE